MIGTPLVCKDNGSSYVIGLLLGFNEYRRKLIFVALEPYVNVSTDITNRKPLFTVYQTLTFWSLFIICFNLVPIGIWTYSKRDIDIVTSKHSIVNLTDIHFSTKFLSLPPSPPPRLVPLQKSL